MCTTFKLCNHQSNSKAHSRGLITRIKILFIFITCYVKISLIHTQYISIIFYYYRQLHMSRSDFQISTTSRILSFPHLHTYLSNCHDVLDLILDQTRSRSRSCHIGCYESSDAFHSACQQSKVFASCFLHKGMYCVNVWEYITYLCIAYKIFITNI